MTINWHRQHKWSSIAATLFIILFCLSGIVLNHRDLVRDAGISRSVLPPFYRHENWSGGLMRGSMPMASPDGVAVYGTGGIWLATGRAAALEISTQGCRRRPITVR